LANQAAKGVGEGALVVEAEAEGDLGDALLGRDESIRGSLDACADDVLLDGLIEMAIEQPLKPPRASWARCYYLPERPSFSDN
jgi:hypothetical protein